ncbi:g11672 [Coccomyxa elongata]
MLEKLASIRMYITGAGLRSMLERLVNETLTECQEAVPCRPGQPFYVEGRPDRLTVLFPVYLRGTSDDALITAFAQESAEARHHNGSSNGPQITFTHPGQSPVFDVTNHPCWKASDRIAGYITVVILPAHLPSPERIDAVTWTLLTLPAHLDFTTKAFKASLHEHLRGTYEELLGQLQSARCDSVEGGSRQAHRAVAVPMRAPTPVNGSLLDRIRAKAHAAPVRDMGSMLNRHKENVHANLSTERC